MKTMLFALTLLAGAAQAQTVDPTGAPTVSPPADTMSQPATAATPMTPVNVADASDKKICKLERELGSNRAKRVCHTREELDAQSEASRAAISAAQRGH